MLLALTRPLPGRRVRGVADRGGPALPALLVAIYYMFALSVDPLSGLWYLLMLVTGHSVGLADLADRLRDAGRAVRDARDLAQVAGCPGVTFGASGR